MIPLMSVSLLYISIIFFISSIKKRQFLLSRSETTKPHRISIFAEDTLPLNVRTYDQPHITIYAEKLLLSVRISVFLRSV